MSDPLAVRLRSGVVTPDQLEDFRRLFLEWFQSGWNQEAFEAGGVPDLEDLAQKVLQWAETHCATPPQLERLIDIEDAEAALAEAREKGTITLKALKKKLGI